MRRVSILSVSVLSVSVLGATLLGGCGLGGLGEGTRDLEAAGGLESAEGLEPAELAVRRGEVVPRLLLTGQVQAREGVVLTGPSVRIFPMSIRWLADDGSQVSRGDRVVELDNSQLVSRYEELALRVQTAGGDLAKQELEVTDQVEEARLQLERSRTAHAKAALEARVPDGLMAEQEIEQRRLAEVKARLELEAARARLESVEESSRRTLELSRLELADAEREMEQVLRGIDQLTLRAPRDGIVQIAEDPRRGQPLRDGDSIWVGQVAARLPDLGTLQVEAELFDVDEGRLREGQEVGVTLDGFPGEILNGTVSQISRLAELASPQSTRRVFRVAVAVQGLDPERARPGMSARLVAEAEPIQGSVVPRQSLRWQGLQAELQLADGRWVEVGLGACDARHCLLESGPEEGTRLAWAAERKNAGGEKGERRAHAG
ncbi:MAG: HlyD family efflux transporter periplasmic adaptor subunit [Holophagales bacterium]|nr:HlyD family efflux transporter periplasmic adaptor subunit [Holophagales bacterium]